jgi:hypothetical protein
MCSNAHGALPRFCYHKDDHSPRHPESKGSE